MQVAKVADAVADIGNDLIACFSQLVEIHAAHLWLRKSLVGKMVAVEATTGNVLARGKPVKEDNGQFAHLSQYARAADSVLETAFPIPFFLNLSVSWEQDSLASEEGRL